jgi:hypothetical protein
MAAPSTLRKALDTLYAVVQRYIWRPHEWEYTALTLWAAHTHFREAFSWYPHLVLRSPAGGYGKTQTLILLNAVVENGWYSDSCTRAAMLRYKDQDVTLIPLLDQAEVRDPQWAVLIDIASRRGATWTLVERTTSTGFTERNYKVGGPMALGYVRSAHAEPLTPTNISRCIVLDYLEKPSEEWYNGVPKLSYDVTEAPDDAKRVRRLLTKAAETSGMTELLVNVHTCLPSGGRRNDTYRPLFQLATVAAGPWVPRAQEMYHHAHTSFSLNDNQQVLQDIVALYKERPGLQRVPTSKLLKELHGMEESPWRERAENTHILGRMLGAWGIHSRPMRIEGESKVKRGYLLQEIRQKYQAQREPRPEWVKEE